MRRSSTVFQEYDNEFRRQQIEIESEIAGGSDAVERVGDLDGSVFGEGVGREARIVALPVTGRILRPPLPLSLAKS